jgi:hypothetical protein
MPMPGSSDGDPCQRTDELEYGRNLYHSSQETIRGAASTGCRFIPAALFSLLQILRRLDVRRTAAAQEIAEAIAPDIGGGSSRPPGISRMGAAPVSDGRSADCPEASSATVNSHGGTDPTEIASDISGSKVQKPSEPA